MSKGSGKTMSTLTIGPAVALEPKRKAAAARAAWPAEAEFIMSALDAGRIAPAERRGGDRVTHRALGELRLFSDQTGTPPWTLYTRDGSPRGLGFITRHRLPLGYGGVVELRGPNGEELSISCTVRRCRETVNGWFEGSLSFNREQWAFDGDNVRACD
jgi:hypothetical protein